MKNVKLLHVMCCFFQLFNSPVALKNKKFGPSPRKSWNDAPAGQICTETSLKQGMNVSKKYVVSWNHNGA